MPESFDLQRVIADAWSAGYEARESELVYRRRSSNAQRQAEIAHLTKQVMSSVMPAVSAVEMSESAVLS